MPAQKLQAGEWLAVTQAQQIPTSPLAVWPPMRFAICTRPPRRPERPAGSFASLRRKGTPMKRFLAATLGLFLLAGSLQAANPVVVMETSLGTIKIELNEEKAP